MCSVLWHAPPVTHQQRMSPQSLDHQPPLLACGTTIPHMSYGTFLLTVLMLPHSLGSNWQPFRTKQSLEIMQVKQSRVFRSHLEPKYSHQVYKPNAMWLLEKSPAPHLTPSELPSGYHSCHQQCPPLKGFCAVSLSSLTPLLRYHLFSPSV